LLRLDSRRIVAQRNSVWRNLIGPGTRAVHTPDEQAEFEARLVAGLRLTAARYPADQRLKRLIGELSVHSPRLVELWESGDLEPHHDYGRHKVVDHPDVGLITLDCDTLVVAADDLRIMIYTAEPGTEDSERLALAVVLGAQAFMS
jgi:MmyB-like transcription regulator ligand binding domain